MIALLGAALASGDGPVETSPDVLVVERSELEQLRQEVRALRETLDDRRTTASVVSYGDAVHVPFGREVQEAVSFGEDIRIDGTVRGDVTAMGGDIVIGSRGIVRGDVVAFGGRVELEDGAIVRGDRVDLSDGVGTSTDEPETSWLTHLYNRVVLMLSLAGAGVLVVGLFPQRVHRIADGLERRPIFSAFIGSIVSVLLTVFAVLFTLLTLGLGLPVSFLGMALLAAAWLFGFVGLCQAIGDRLPFAQKPHGRWIAFLVGMALVSCVGSLPWIGMVVVFGASMISVGAALTSRFGNDQRGS